MANLTVFNFLTINGFYKGEDGDISWHMHGGEEGEYSASGLSHNNILVFGRKTYELMAGYWPTQDAKATYPVVAEGMNAAEKIVFSKKLTTSNWAKTRIMSDDAVTAIKKLKKESKRDLTILGSGTLIGQLADAKLIDSYEFMIDPVAIPSGTPIFYNSKRKIDLKLVSSRKFNSGIILLSYEQL